MSHIWLIRGRIKGPTHTETYILTLWPRLRSMQLWWKKLVFSIRSWAREIWWLSILSSSRLLVEKYGSVFLRTAQESCIIIKIILKTPIIWYFDKDIEISEDYSEISVCNFPLVFTLPTVLCLLSQHYQAGKHHYAGKHYRAGKHY